MSEYVSLPVNLPGEDEDFEIHVPAGCLPRSGDVIDLTYDASFPRYARRRVTVGEVRWYEAVEGRYRPLLVIDTPT